MDKWVKMSCARWGRGMCLAASVQDATDIRYRGKVSKEGYQVCEFGIMRIIEPGRDGDGIIRVENVRGGRVVQNDGVSDGAAKLRKILYPWLRKRLTEIIKQKMSGP